MTRRRFVTLQVVQFALVGLVALVIVGFGTSVASHRVGEREAIADARSSTVIKAKSVVEPALGDDITSADPALAAAARARLDDAVRAQVLSDSLVRVKVWAADGTILYADEAQLVGQRFPLGDDESESLGTGRIEAEVSDLAKPENRYETQFRKLLEVYLPVRTPSRQTVLFEAYYRYALVDANSSRLWKSFAPVSLGALVMLELIQLPIAWSLARRLRQRVQEREGLLRRALEASEIERRQIASDLHDGPVQNLAGVAYTLSAAARTHHDPSLEDAAEALRGGVKDLRSLIVDIYPPDFDDVPFDSALADLLARASDQGLDVDLDTDGLDDPLPDGTARLLYRAAQEGVRNTLTHAGATSVAVRVSTAARRAAIEVVDDGRGVSGAELAARRAEGHVGLQALRGLVADAGGTLALESAPDTGTVLRVEVPL